MSRCPKCDRALDALKCNPIDATLPGNGASVAAFNFACPHCHVVLGVSVDPLAMQEAIIENLGRGLAQLLAKRAEAIPSELSE